MLLLLLACPPKHPLSGKRVQMESFEYAHARIEEAHYDEDMNGVDWDAVYDELAPQAKKAKTNAELRPVLEDMFSRLGDSHYSVMPLEAAEGLPLDDMVLGNGVLDMDVRVIDDQVLVLRSGLEGVEVGWVLERIGDIDLAEWRQARAGMGPRLSLIHI